MKRILPCLLVFLLLLSGCKQGNTSLSSDAVSSSVSSAEGSLSSVTDTNSDKSETAAQVSTAQTTASSTITTGQPITEKSESDMLTDRDYTASYDPNAVVTITLKGNTATSSSNSVKISGSTITITEEATYLISGTLNDGMIIVNTEDTAKPQLVLKNAHIIGKTSAPLTVLEADKVFLTLAEGSTNSLSNGGSFITISETNIDATLFSKQDLTINGSGSLTVSSPAGHGIVCKDDLVISGGNYTVNAASHGLDANDSVRIANAKITVDAGKDGIHVENTDDVSLGFVYISSGTFQLDAEGDGISASGYMQIDNGSYRILSGGGSKNGSKQSSDSWGDFMGGGRPGQSSSSASDDSTSMKGIKASSNLLIKNGTFSINSADDAVHSNTSVTINGGSFEIASGDDAFHADETLKITAGKINITESYEGLEGLDIAVSGGEINLVASDDGLNAAGGNDQSGTEGGRDGMFGGGFGGKPGGGFGGGMSSSSNGSIVISGGTLYVKASGDGIDANGTLSVTGGHTTVCGPTQGDTATLDYDKSATVTGGTFIGTGGSGMAQTFSDATQGVLAVNVGNQPAGTKITLKDKSGKMLLSHTPELSFAVVILSCPDMVSGENYTFTVGSTSKEFAAS